MDLLPSTNSIITLLIIVLIIYILFKVFKMLISLLWVVAFFFVAYLTNPGYDAHERALMKKEASSDVTIEGRYMEVDDYKVVSFTKFGKKAKLVGIGAFTQVWIFGSLED